MDFLLYRGESYYDNMPIGNYFAFGEMRLISIIIFRLCGEHLLSLHDESRQSRAKERKDNRSERFSSLSLESFPSFDRSRFASAHKCAVSHVYEIVKMIPATLAWLRFEALTAREPVLEFDCVRFLAADALGASARGPNRGYMSGHCPPGAVDEWEK